MTVFLEIRRDNDFNENILPKIDALAAEQNKTITDVIRDILYASSSYKPMPCSRENANKIHIEEQKDDRSMKRRRILVAVDMVYYYAFYLYIITLPGRLERNCNSYLRQVLYLYFGMEVPNNGSAEIPTMQPFDLSNPQPLRPIKISGLLKQTEDYCPS
jgi:hypothetical protein